MLGFFSLLVADSIDTRRVDVRYYFSEIHDSWRVGRHMDHKSQIK